MFTLFTALRTSGGRAFIVGGAARDAALSGDQPKDLDIEVFGLSPEAVECLLRQFGRVEAVGASFGVFKLSTPDGQDIDVSLPRRENKAGQGHRGFIVTPDPDMRPQDAAARRDFTINGIMLDPLTGEVLDFFGGRADWQAKTLRHIGPAFAEDPLRVLRAMQFAARWDFRLAPETAALCRSLVREFGSLPKERLWGEWQKWGLRGKRPSAGLRALAEAGWLGCFPQIARMEGVLGDPQKHPEGDVLTHTMLVCDEASTMGAGLAGEDRLVLMFAALCHDMGKPATTVLKDGRWASPGHEKAGIPIAEEFLNAIGAPGQIVQRVLALVEWHMAHRGLADLDRKAQERAARRLSHRLGQAGETVAMLGRLILADRNGRPPLPGGPTPNLLALLEAAQRVQALEAAPKPILMGRHLVDMGWRPGPAIGRALQAAFEAQLDGTFSDLPGAVAWLAGQGIFNPG